MTKTKKYIKNLGVRLDSVAKSIGITSTSLGNWINHPEKLTFERAFRLYEGIMVLGVKVNRNDLFFAIRQDTRRYMSKESD